MKRFRNRQEAGQILAQELERYAKRGDALVLGLPRGGVPVAYEVAKALQLPLDVFIVRKLGVPGHEELAMGAIASGGITVFNKDILAHLNISKAVIDDVIQAEHQELQRREVAYRGNRSAPIFAGKTIILVDDGIATGATMRAAIAALQRQNPAKIIVAVPVSATYTYEEITKIVDKVVCPLQPSDFGSVGMWYEDFVQTSDEEVYKLLKQS